MSYKVKFTENVLSKVKRLGIFTSSTLDGYWEERALQDLEYVYALGQKHATDSFTATIGKRSTRIRSMAISRFLKENKPPLDPPLNQTKDEREQENG
jgi:hypothetical protein